MPNYTAISPTFNYVTPEAKKGILYGSLISGALSAIAGGDILDSLAIGADTYTKNINNLIQRQIEEEKRVDEQQKYEQQLLRQQEQDLLEREKWINTLAQQEEVRQRAEATAKATAEAGIQKQQRDKWIEQKNWLERMYPATQLLKIPEYQGVLEKLEYTIPKKTTTIPTGEMAIPGHTAPSVTLEGRLGQEVSPLSGFNIPPTYKFETTETPIEPYKEPTEWKPKTLEDLLEKERALKEIEREYQPEPKTATKEPKIFTIEKGNKKITYWGVESDDPSKWQEISSTSKYKPEEKVIPSTPKTPTPTPKTTQADMWIKYENDKKINTYREWAATYNHLIKISPDKRNAEQKKAIENFKATYPYALDPKLPYPDWFKVFRKTQEKTSQTTQQKIQKKTSPSGKTQSNTPPKGWGRLGK